MNVYVSIKSMFQLFWQYVIAACCELPHIDNGALSGDWCTEGATILVDVDCDVDCDDNHMESVSSVTCVSAGNLNDAPACEGMLLINAPIDTASDFSIRMKT